MVRREPMICLACGSEMNKHAEKVDSAWLEDEPPEGAAFGGEVREIHACPGCGDVASRPALDGTVQDGA